MVLLNEYFRRSFSEPLNRGEIPYCILDSKDVLRTLRAQIANDYHLSFSDTDICRAFRTDEIPEDLRTVLVAVQELFPALPPGGQQQQLLELDQPAEEEVADVEEQGDQTAVQQGG